MRKYPINISVSFMEQVIPYFFLSPYTDKKVHRNQCYFIEHEHGEQVRRNEEAEHTQREQGEPKEIFFRQRLQMLGGEVGAEDQHLYMKENFMRTDYGFRPGKSAQKAVLKAVEYMNEGYNWIVDIDLEKFFDTVEHDKLISVLNKEIKDGKILSLIRKFLVSGVMVGEQIEETEIGTPQGGNISPLLANILLNELDWGT